MDPFAVLVARGLEPDGLVWLGSGTVIGRRLVLTARHVLQNDGTKLCVRVQPGAAPVPVTVLLPPDDDLDIALLRVDRDLGVPHASLAPRAPGLNEPWEATGYPRVRADSPSDESHSVKGTTLSASADARALQLDVDRGPEDYGGLSGAAVRVGHKVVAVVQSLPLGWSGGRLHATPVQRFSDAPWYLEALGHRSAQVQIRDELGALIDGLTTDFADHPQLYQALKAALGVEPHQPKDLAEIVVGTSAKELVFALNKAAAALHRLPQRPRADLRAVETVLQRVMPYVVDFRDTLVAARVEHSVGGNRFQIAWGTETIAEVIIAGIEGRECAFVAVDGGSGPRGVGFVAWPSTDFATLRRSRELMRDAVLQNFASQLGLDVVASTARSFGLSTSGGPADLAVRVEENLKDEAEGLWSRPRRYLLVIDAELGGPEAGALAWELVQDALAETLPSLRLVRLTACDPEDRRSEYAINIKIDHILKAKDRP